MPGTKRYEPVVSRKQRAYLFSAASRGELPMHEALGKSRAAKGKRLPRYVRPRRTVRTRRR